MGSIVAESVIVFTVIKFVGASYLVYLGMVFFTVALASDTVWALTAGSARAWFARNPKRLARMSAGGGVMMIGLGGGLALSGSKT